jgi:hypothetical protein
MAIVNGNVLGNLRGKLGNLSARTVNGKTVLAARPSSFNASQDPDSLAVRSKFAVTAKLASQVISMPTLETIWKKVQKVANSVFNEVFQRNFAYSSTTRPTVDNIITPEGFALPVQSALVLADTLTVELLALTSASVFTPEEVNLSANGIVCYYDPTNPADPAFQFITLNNEIANYNFSQTFELNIPFNVNQEALAAKYQHSILFFIVASKSADGKVVQNSATYTKLS